MGNGWDGKGGYIELGRESREMGRFGDVRSDCKGLGWKEKGRKIEREMKKEVGKMEGG